MVSPPTPSSVFVPVTLTQLRALRDGEQIAGPLRAFGVTEALLRWGEFGPDDVEDAAFAAQTFAECQALINPSDDVAAPRIVLALPEDGFVAQDPDGFGLGLLPQVQWPDVLAVFADDADTDVRAARGAAQGLDIEQAWAHEAVEALIDEHELSWYEPSEVAEW